MNLDQNSSPMGKLIKSIFLGCVFIFLFILFVWVGALSKKDFIWGIGFGGFIFSVFGAGCIFFNRSSNIKNYLSYLKKRVALKEKIRGMMGYQKLQAEIKLLDEQSSWYGKFGGGKEWWLQKFKNMDPEETEKIGNENEIKKTGEKIRAIEELFPFYGRIVFGSGLVLVIISAIFLFLNK